MLADYSGEIGNSVPIYYWNELAVRWGVSAETTGTSLQALFTDQKFLSCCKRIIEGFDEVWDGNNFVGKYTGDASDAIEEAEGIINQTLECCEVWSVEDYLFSNCSLREHWDEQPVEQAVAELESSVENNCEVDGDFEDALLEKAKDEMYWHADHVNRNHVKTLWGRGLVTLSEVRNWLKEIK